MSILFMAFMHLPLFIACIVCCIIFLKKASKTKITSQCEECGNELKENEKICSKCGNPIKNTEKQKSLYYVIVGASAVGALFFGMKLLRFFYIIFFL